MRGSRILTRPILARPWIPLLALLAACSDRGADGDAAGPPRYGGTVVIANNSDLRDLNPLVASEKNAQEVNQYMLFMPLIRHAADLSFEPALATSWEMLGDTGVIFQLRRDIRWHDGELTTSRDVVFTFERARDPESAYHNADHFRLWTSAEATDSFTVQFTFQPHMDPLVGWVFLPVAPAHLLDTIPPARMLQASFNRAPVGNGPFRFVENRQNDRWVFEANPDFPEAMGGRPYLDRVVWRPIPDVTAQTAELRTGAADIALTPGADQYKALQHAPGIRGIYRQGRQYANAIWNGRVPPLDDPRVRLALGLAIDRQQIIEVLRAGFGEEAAGPIGAWHWAFDPAVEPLPFSPDSARALLRAAGLEDRNGDAVLDLPNGRPFQIELKIPAGSVINRDMAELIRGDLSRVGVRIVARPTDWGTMVEDFTSPQRNFQAILLAYQNDFRINLRDFFHTAAIGTPNQFSSYSNPRVDTLIDRTHFARSLEDAKPLYSEIQRILRDEQPWSFLYFFPDLVLVRDRLQGVEMDHRGMLRTISQWWVADPRPAEERSQDDSEDRSRDPDPAPAQ